MEQKVKKRAVFFLGGFDPRGGRNYYSLYKEEASKQVEVSPYTLDVSKRKRDGKYKTLWTIDYSDVEDGERVHTEYRTLDYDDIIRNHWQKSESAVIRSMLKNYWQLYRNGFFAQGWKVYHPLFFTAIFWFLLVAAVIVLGAVSSWAIFQFTELHVGLKAVLSVVAFIVLWKLSNLLDKRFNHYWLLRGICFSGSQDQFDDPDYDPRMEFFAQQIKEADESDAYDEIIVAGHSSGSIWMVDALARALQQDEKLGTRRAEVNAYTMGNTIPLMSGSRRNKGLHGQLLYLAQCKRIDWVDVSAKIDLATAFKVDPVAIIYDKPDDFPEDYLPRIKVSRFFNTFTKEGYAELKKDRYKIHFQYIMAQELDGEYDYFRITAGPQTLREYFPKDAD